MTNPNSLENPTLAFVGGGSTGQTAAEYLNAIDAGLVPGAENATVYAIVTTGDSGGGTGALREMYGGNAHGDARRSISDLSVSSYAGANFESRVGTTSSKEEALASVGSISERLEASLSYTNSSFDSGRRTEILSKARDLAGEIYDQNPAVLAKLALGHLVIQSMINETGDFQGALDEASDFMQARGQVIAVSTVPHNVNMRDGDTIVYGEHQIDEHIIQHPDDVDVALSPVDPSDRVILNPRARDAIAASDEVVVGPGSVYTSIVPALLPEGMPQALADVRNRGGKLAIVTNLLTQPTETDGWTAGRYVKTARKYAETPFTDVVVNNNTADLPEDRAVRYSLEEFEEEEVRYLRVHATDMVKKEVKVYDRNNPIKNRSAVAHDMGAAAAALTPTLSAA